MSIMTVQLRSVANTQAAMGSANGHAIMIDRPKGTAGGLGLGFNGGQLLALAIGGCFCNDLHAIAHETGVRLTSLAIDVAVTFDGNPLIATHAVMKAAATADQGDAAAVIARAREISAVSNSLRRGVPVEIVGR